MTQDATARASPGRDWRAWHDDYANPSSPLSRRLAIVRGRIEQWLDSRPDTPVTIVSACAGQGHDLLGVLSRRPDATRVRATLLEFDQANVAAAREIVARQELGRVEGHGAEGHGVEGYGVEVRCVDAGELSSYVDVVPADLVLFAGIFGNIADADIERSIHQLPQLCAAGASVIWTRTRKPPDATPAVRRWFDEAGFDEVSFDAPDRILFSVGVHRLRSHPVALGSGRMFTFTR